MTDDDIKAAKTALAKLPQNMKAIESSLNNFQPDKDFE